MNYLHVRNWDRWQSYRSDRGQPPWIKVHRSLMRNLDWVRMPSAERGQLVAIWMLAADREGTVPDDPVLVARLCFMDAIPDLERLIGAGFLERRHADAKTTPTGRHADANMSRQRREEKSQSRDRALAPDLTLTGEAVARSGGTVADREWRRAMRANENHGARAPGQQRPEVA